MTVNLNATIMWTNIFIMFVYIVALVVIGCSKPQTNSKKNAKFISIILLVIIFALHGYCAFEDALLPEESKLPWDRYIYSVEFSENPLKETENEATEEYSDSELYEKLEYNTWVSTTETNYTVWFSPNIQAQDKIVIKTDTDRTNYFYYFEDGYLYVNENPAAKGIDFFTNNKYSVSFIDENTVVFTGEDDDNYSQIIILKK